MYIFHGSVAATGTYKRLCRFMTKTTLWFAHLLSSWGETLRRFTLLSNRLLYRGFRALNGLLYRGSILKHVPEFMHLFMFSAWLRCL